MMNKRIIATIILCLVVVISPYWIYIPLLVLAIFFFKFYWEGIMLGFLIDVLYGPTPHIGISFVFPFAIYASIFVLILLPLHERLRFNAQ